MVKFFKTIKSRHGKRKVFLWIYMHLIPDILSQPIRSSATTITVKKRAMGNVETRKRSPHFDYTSQLNCYEASSDSGSNFSSEAVDSSSNCSSDWDSDSDLENSLSDLGIGLCTNLHLPYAYLLARRPNWIISCWESTAKAAHCVA